MTQAYRVMCVEDDPDIRTILAFSLGHVGGFEVCLCAGGLDAVARAPVFAPQLVLLDVMMPGLNGPQTLEQLRQLPCMADVPVVFVTAKAMAHEVQALLAHGATGVIVKPFDPITLPEHLRTYLNRPT